MGHWISGSRDWVYGKLGKSGWDVVFRLRAEKCSIEWINSSGVVGTSANYE